MFTYKMKMMFVLLGLYARPGLSFHNYQLQTNLRQTYLHAKTNSLSKAKEAWKRKTLGLLEDGDVQEDKVKLMREAKFAWAHIQSARRAVGEGFEDKARASYYYYLNRFQNDSAILLTDAFLRLAILEQNAGNVTGAKSAFRMGARKVSEALRAQKKQEEEDKYLRERAATLYCSWGLHEYKFAALKSDEERIRLSSGYFRHAVQMDASKLPILSWNRFQTRLSTKLYARPQDDIEHIVKAEIPTWKSKQNERYQEMTEKLLHAVDTKQQQPQAIEAAAETLERRAGKRSPALSPQLLGKYKLVYAAPTQCAACAQKTQAQDKAKNTQHLPSQITFFGPGMKSSVNQPLTLDSICRCEFDGAVAAFRPTANNILDFSVVDSSLAGPTKITYLDTRLLLMRRPGCTKPLLVFERLDYV